MNDLGRREFLKIFGTAIGGVMLTSCVIGGGDGSGGDKQSDIPNGYRFYRVKSLGDAIYTGFDKFVLDHFYGSVLIASNGIITFNARNYNNRGGIFQLGVDFNGSRPDIQWERAAVLAGNELADGRIVRRTGAFDVNDAGNIAAVITAANPLGSAHYGDGLYLDYERNGFQPLIITNDRLGVNPFFSSGVMGDVDIHDNNDILFVSDYNAGKGMRFGEAIFHLPGGCPGATSVILKAGDILPDSDYSITSIGLIDMNDGGNFTAQAAVKSLTAEAAEPENYSEISHDLVCSGNVNNFGEIGIISMPPELDNSQYQGKPFYGPRIAPDGKKLIVYSDDIGNQKFVFNDNVILGTGSRMLSQYGRILGFGPGSIAPDGILYYTLIAENTGLCLMASDLDEHRILLAAGDVLSDGGAPVESIEFGASTKHVDAEGRIALICNFTDGTNSLVVGIPC
ncbi:MAG: hypothetical protein KGY38_05680 [Desulfobacterales bacterium]|nr:hypothetical protein [Desulfobacterales bacterium]